MPNTLRLNRSMCEQLWGHLHSDRQEQVAFVLAETVVGDNGVRFTGRELYLVPPEDFAIHESFHVTLTDEAQARIIKLAWGNKLALTEFHSHRDLNWPAQFSPSDLEGLNEFVPHVRWRLKAQPYLAVVAGSSDYDALVWRTETPEGLGAILVGTQALVPTGLTMQALHRGQRQADG